MVLSTNTLLCPSSRLQICAAETLVNLTMCMAENGSSRLYLILFYNFSFVGFELISFYTAQRQGRFDFGSSIELLKYLISCLVHSKIHHPNITSL